MKFEQARLKYRPDNIKYLLVAETPPKSDSNRFFYFLDVKKQDSLFLEVMKVLYADLVENLKTIEIRSDKKLYLNKFKKDGFYLIDSLNEPFEEKYSSAKKIKLLKEGQHNLLNKIKGLVTPQTKVILISATVYKANYIYLKNNNISLAHKTLIDFPGSGGQKKFRTKFTKALNNLD